MAAPAITWGILAPGGIANKFANNVLTHTASTIGAVGSRSLERAQAFADRHQISTAYGSYAELMADPSLDAIYIASPHSHHYEQALAALEAGKPVLVEKAFTQYGWQARELIATARANDLFIMEAMWTRFLPQMHAIRGLIRQGALGDIKYLTAHHGQAISHVERLKNPDLAGGALLDLGIYPISFALDILGIPGAVTARGDVLGGVDATAVITLEFPEAPGGGAYAQLSTTLLAASENNAQIVGTQGRLVLDATFYQLAPLRLVRGDQVENIEFPATLATSGSRGFEFQAAEVARRLEAGDIESPLRPHEETIATLEIIDSIRHSIGQRYPGE